jgi:ankyrin repeat protein
MAAEAPEQQLFNAARDGNMEAVEALIVDRVPLDTIHPLHRVTPFVIAVRNGHFDIARRLAEAGADVNNSNRTTKRTLLISIIRNESVEKLQQFLELPGVNPNVPDDDGDTPLIHAVTIENLEKVRLLLTAHADPNVKGQHGSTALQASILHGRQFDIFMALLNTGADPNIPGGFNTPVILDALTNVETEDGLRFAKELMRRGANINGVEFDGHPLFHSIVAFTEVPSIRFAIDHGANVNEADEEGIVPLLVAIEEEKSDAFKVLLRAGARVTPRVRAAVEEADGDFARSLADYEKLEQAIYTEPLPMGMRANNVWARQNASENINAITANLNARRRANVGDTGAVSASGSRGGKRKRGTKRRRAAKRRRTFRRK